MSLRSLMATGECLMPDVCEARSSHGILYGPVDHKPDSSLISKVLREANHPLDVHDFREVVLAGDEKSVTITLNERDAKSLKTLAAKSSHGWLVAVAPPRNFSAGTSSIAVIPITAAMASGSVTFSHAGAGAVAENLRHRFRIAEFRLAP